jgi:hypothetical protein
MDPEAMNPKLYITLPGIEVDKFMDPEAMKQATEMAHEITNEQRFGKPHQWIYWIGRRRFNYVRATLRQAPPVDLLDW